MTRIAARRDATYRADIDGLRAIAVLMVLFFHYDAAFPGAAWFGGGFTGVDVFFVISGFLITQRLSGDISAGRFSLVKFYAARMRRILPALVVVLVTSLAVGRVLLMPGDFKDLAASAASAAFGASNLFFMWNTGYFDQAAELMPLLHTWSLGVEEQFYLVWPLVLVLIARRNSNLNIAAVVAALVVVGFGASLVWLDIDRKGAFFVVFPRVWELAIGAMLVFLPPLQRHFGEAATATGLALIAAGLTSVSVNAFPGASALYPCLGASLVVCPRQSKTIAASCLGSLGPIGLISYSLYLWHWPVWVFFRVYINNGRPGPIEAIALLAASFTLAFFSWRFVEIPFRRRWIAPPGSTITAGLAAIMGVFCAAMFIHSDDGMPRRISRDIYAMQSLEKMWDWPCIFRPVGTDLPPLCTFGSPWESASRKVLLWGDSNAEHLAPFVNIAAETQHTAVIMAPTCAPVLDGKSLFYIEPDANNRFCGGINAGLESMLRDDAAIQTVILAGSWSPFIDAIHGGNGPARMEAAMTGLIERLLAMKRRVVLVTTPPQWYRDPLPCALRDSGLPRRACGDNERQLTRAEVDGHNKVSLALFARLHEKFPALSIINPIERLCDTALCLTRINGEFLYRDGGHFRRNLSPETNAEMAQRLGIDELLR